MPSDEIKHRFIRLIVLALTFVAVVTTLSIPTPHSWDGTWESFHLPLAISAVMSCAYLAAAGLFLSSLSAYKTKLRVAYAILSVAIVLNAAGAVQLAVINAFDLLESPWVQTGGVILPFFLSGLAIYF